jgi:hypothetical protein
MHVQPRQSPLVKAQRVRRLLGVTLVVALFAAVAAIPTGTALATPTSEESVEVTTPITLPTTPTDVLDPLLTAVPLKDLNMGGLDATQLSEVLANLPALKGLVTPPELAQITMLLSGNPDITLGELAGGSGLLGTLLKFLGLNETLTPNEVLGGLLGSVSNPAEAKEMVERLLTQLGSAIQGKDPADLKSLVEELLGTLGGSQLTELESKLGASSVTELVSKITALLGTGSPSEIESRLKELLGGLKFETGTLGTLATQLGTSVEILSTDLGTTAEEALPTLIAPLTNGKLLTIVDGSEGLKITTLETKTSKEAAQEKEAKESKEAKERSASTSTGGSGSNGAAGATSVVVNLPATPVIATPSVLAPKAVTKIKILSHRVKGHVATLVLQVPAAGKVVVSGGGVRGIGKGATKSERLTVRIPLSKAGSASLRKHRNRLSVALKASFKPTSGSSSSASVTVHFA